MKPINILYFVQLPPPVHGVSFINDFITNSNKINENFKISILNINFDNTHGSINKLSIKKF